MLCEDDWNPRYNIAPTQPIPVIRQNPKEPVRELSLMKWGRNMGEEPGANLLLASLQEIRPALRV